MTLPLISVIIPAYNSSVFIRETVESALTQTTFAFDVEVIVVDDGSKDSTARVAKSAGAVVVSKENGGVSSSRNAGFSLSRGQYLLFLDGDDRLRPLALSVLFEALTVDPSRRAVFAMAQDFISPELPVKEKVLLRPRSAPYFGLLTGSMLICRDAFEQVGPFDEKRPTGDAVEWLIRLKDQNIQTFQVDFISVDRRLHLTNTGRLYRMQEKFDYANILRRRLKAQNTFTPMNIESFCNQL